MAVQFAQAVHEIVGHGANVDARGSEVIQAERPHHNLAHAAPLVLHQRNEGFGAKQPVEMAVDDGNGAAVVAAVERNLDVFWL